MPRQLNHSDDSDDEHALEAELEKLQLQYKVSEQQRLQYSIEVQKKIRLQKYKNINPNFNLKKLYIFLYMF